MTDLYVVVDPDYGVRLEKLAQLAPVWIVDTERNKEALQRFRKTHPHSDYREKGSVTSYKAQNPEARLNSLIAIMPQMETHHGELVENEFVFPEGFVLGVVGLDITDDITRALREIGFRSIIKTPEGSKPANSRMRKVQLRAIRDNDAQEFVVSAGAGWKSPILTMIRPMPIRHAL